MRQMETPTQFVQWLRSVAPYIHAFRGKTFVVAFPGELVTAGALTVLAQDLSLLVALGIRVVIVHGSRPQVAEQLALRNVEGRFHNGIRITDTAALECAKEAAGELRLDIEAAFSQGLPNTPMSNAAIRIISGNFVTARPLGVIDGVDLELTGVIRKVAAETIHPILATDSIVLLSPLGFSPTGEVFNLTMEDVAVLGRHRPAGRQADLHQRDADDARRRRRRDPRTVVAPGRSGAAGRLPAGRRGVLPAARDQGLQQRRRARPHRAVRDGRLGPARTVHPRWRGHHDQPRKPRKPAQGEHRRRRRHHQADRAARSGRHAGQARPRTDRARDRQLLGDRARWRDLRLRRAVPVPCLPRWPKWHA